MLDKSSTIGILGAGTMGAGFAVTFAKYGCSVMLYDIDQEALRQARATMTMALDVLSDAGQISANDREPIEARIRTMETLSEAAANASAIVEAAPEDLEMKQELFGRLNEYIDDEVILATNTSGLSITEIATAVERPQRLLGTH